MKPAFSVSVGGVSVTGNLTDRLLQLEVTDQEGSQSDTVSIRVDDRNGLLQIPKQGTLISVALGYRESGIRPMGMFTVDTASVSGWPRQMEITGKALDFTKMMKEQRSKGYEKKTVGQICGDIAKRHGLQNGCTGTIAQLKLDYLGQTEESDANFLQKIADEHDSIFAVKDGRLILKKKGENVTGFAIITHPGNVMEYNFSYQDRNSHSGGETEWWDRKTAKRIRAKSYGGGSKRGQSPAKSRSPKLHTNGKAEAEDAAKSRVSALKRAEKKLTMTIVGNPNIRAEMILLVAGVRSEVDGSYRIKSVVHSLSPDGYKTNITAEGIA